MKQKNYSKPKIQIVELKHRNYILQISGGDPEQYDPDKQSKSSPDSDPADLW